jgi:hypothetical protein
VRLDYLLSGALLFSLPLAVRNTLCIPLRSGVQPDFDNLYLDSLTARGYADYNGKGVRGMPWHLVAMKGVASGDKPGGAASRQ